MKAYFSIFADGIVLEINSEDKPNQQKIMKGLSLKQAQDLAAQLNKAVAEEIKAEQEFNAWLLQYSPKG